jgi:hypothetical protein
VLPESDLRDLKLREAFFEQLRWWRLLFGQPKKPYQKFLAGSPTSPVQILASPDFMQFAVRGQAEKRTCDGTE